MCHSSGMQSAQIEKFMAHGMPQKIVKTVEYTIRKRTEEYQRRTQSNAASENRSNNQIDEHNQSSLSASVNPSSKYNTQANTKTITNATTTPTLLTHTNALSDVSSAIATTVNNTNANTAATTGILNVGNKLKIPKLCGRFRRQADEELITNLSGTADIDLSNNASKRKMQHGRTSDQAAVPKMYVDMLAIGTQLTKQFDERLNCAMMKLQNSKIYTMLTKTTQPAHVLAICILSFILAIVGPELIEGTTMHAKHETIVEGRKHKTLAAVAYLGAFATHFGAQIWMTFVSGLSLYFSLPRHTFGQCQQILFPKYFAMNSMLSIGMLILFVKYFLSHWNLAGCIQLLALALTAFIEVTVRLYLAPPMLRLMHEKYKIEGAIGSGQEVGTLVAGDLVQCPHYQRVHKAFRRVHMTVAIGNMLVLLATCLQLYFLASKIQIT